MHGEDFFFFFEKALVMNSVLKTEKKRKNEQPANVAVHPTLRKGKRLPCIRFTHSQAIAHSVTQGALISSALARGLEGNQSQGSVTLV